MKNRYEKAGTGMIIDNKIILYIIMQGSSFSSGS